LDRRGGILLVANFDMTDPKHWLALFIGIILIALGGIPLLSKWGLVDFNLPLSMLGVIEGIALWIISAAGFYLLIDSFFEEPGIRILSILVSLAVLAVGIIPLLHSFGTIAFSIPFLSTTIYYIVFVVEGIFLVIASFTMML
jgi:hypothetical protein